MKNLVLLLVGTALIMLLSGCEVAGTVLDIMAGYNPSYSSPRYYNDSYVTPNAYGYGVHSDQYGRPVRWQVQGDSYGDTSHLKVKQNAYGPGVGMDQYGRPVRAVSY